MVVSVKYSMIQSWVKSIFLADFSKLIYFLKIFFSKMGQGRGLYKRCLSVDKSYI